MPMAASKEQSDRRGVGSRVSWHEHDSYLMLMSVTETGYYVRGLVFLSLGSKELNSEAARKTPLMLGAKRFVGTGT